MNYLKCLFQNRLDCSFRKKTDNDQIPIDFKNCKQNMMHIEKACQLYGISSGNNPSFYPLKVKKKHIPLML